MRNLTLALATLGLSATAAFAGGAATTESEPNDTLLGAQDLGAVVGALAVTASLGAEDVDWYSIDVGPNSLITASVFDFTPTSPFDNDSLVAVYDSLGNQLAFNDDTDGLLSSLSLIVASAGTYYVVVSGFGDALEGDGPGAWDGGHSEAFDYKLIINVSPIPAPAALALLGAAGLMSRRRRA